MQDIIYARINLFDKTTNFILNEQQIAQSIPLEEVDEILNSLCNIYNCKKVHFFGQEQFIQGLLKPTTYNNIEIEVN